MADLDDFFAKKDKKKSKSKKFISSDELVKKLETGIAANKEKEPAKVKKEIEAEEVQQPEEEEWKDFEEEKKDYTGLKLGQLTITEEEELQTKLGGNESDNEGKVDIESNSSDNPWKKSSSSVAEAPSQPTPVPTKNTGVYVAPGVRTVVAKKVKKGVAPDLNNTDYFPSLGTEKPTEPTKTKFNGFEEVKHGSKMKSDSNAPLPVSLGNRFTSLSNDAS